MTRALLQQALDALTTRDVRLHESAAEAIRAELAKPEQPAQEPPCGGRDYCGRRPFCGCGSEAEDVDNEGVNRFAAAMKAKMAKQRAKGYGGWDNKYDCSTTYLQGMLADHITKGDPVDVGNFAMMLFNRGERTAQPAQEPLGIVESAVPGAGGFHARLGNGQVMPKVGTPLYVGIGGKA